jgi:hypothetical protein
MGIARDGILDFEYQFIGGFSSVMLPEAYSQPLLVGAPGFSNPFFWYSPSTQRPSHIRENSLGWFCLESVCGPTLVVHEGALRLGSTSSNQ